MSEATVRDRQKPLKIYVSSDERQKIEALAKDCKLAPSTYLRNVGIGYQPKSAFDREAIQKLAKLHADQVRLGELLKLCMSDKNGKSVPIKNMYLLLQEIDKLQMVIAKLVMEEACHL